MKMAGGGYLEKSKMEDLVHALGTCAGGFTIYKEGSEVGGISKVVDREDMKAKRAKARMLGESLSAANRAMSIRTDLMLHGLMKTAGREEGQPEVVNKARFNDEIRQIDWVFKFNLKLKERNMKPVNNYLSNLAAEGIQFEAYQSKVTPDDLYIKLHSPKKALLKIAKTFNFSPMCNLTIAPLPKKRYKEWRFLQCFHSDLTKRDRFGTELYYRAPTSIVCGKAKEITTAERIMLVHFLLRSTKWGEGIGDYGYRSLLSQRYLVDSYPLHDGPAEWTNEGPLNDRQLLLKFWANQANGLKWQPIDLIFKYYGPEVAFYFTFYGFYNEMLANASILGIITFLYGVFNIVDPYENHVSTMICNSKKILCPLCHYDTLCYYEPLNDYCFLSKLNFLFDNVGSFCYTILMVFWATIFIERWKRKESHYLYKWNLINFEKDPTMRVEFPRRTPYRKYSYILDRMMPYIPSRIRLFRKFISFIVIIMGISVVVLAVISTILFRLTLDYFIVKLIPTDFLRRNVRFITTCCGACLSVAILLTFEKVYEHISKQLTQYENPRTQKEYDASYIIKMYLFSFMNGYSHIFYSAFFKGRFFSYPGDSNQYRSIGLLNSDLCQPFGCMLSVAIQLCITLTGKQMFRSSLNYIKPLIRRLLGRRKKVGERKDVPFFEESAADVDAKHFFLFQDYRDIVMQYGYVVLFTAAFPLAPLVALAFNMMDMRFDAKKLLTLFKRPVPYRLKGIGTWHTILNFITIFGQFTNVFLIAFTTRLIPETMRKYGTNYYGQYENVSFSEFRVDDFKKSVSLHLRTEMKGKTCVYRSHRNPPDHPHKYEYSIYHWHLMAWCFLTVLISQVLLICLSDLLAFAIPDISSSVRENIIKDKERLGELDVVD